MCAVAILLIPKSEDLVINRPTKNTLNVQLNIFAFGLFCKFSNIHYFEHSLFRLKTNTTCLKFLILGDDYDWNIQNIGAAPDITVLQPSKTAAIDLCMLSKCNHTIVTTGTFGWWAAFLANGTSTFQRTFARPGSEHEQMFNIDDYLLPRAMIL